MPLRNDASRIARDLEVSQCSFASTWCENDGTHGRRTLAGKWLRSLPRRTAAFCRLNNAASTIPTAFAGTCGTDPRPLLQLEQRRLQIAGASVAIGKH